MMNEPAPPPTLRLSSYYFAVKNGYFAIYAFEKFKPGSQKNDILAAIDVQQ